MHCLFYACYGPNNRPSSDYGRLSHQCNYRPVADKRILLGYGNYDAFDSLSDYQISDEKTVFTGDTILYCRFDLLCDCPLVSYYDVGEGPPSLRKRDTSVYVTGNPSDHLSAGEKGYYHGLIWPVDRCGTSNFTYVGGNFS